MCSISDVREADRVVTNQDRFWSRSDDRCTLQTLQTLCGPNRQVTSCRLTALYYPPPSMNLLLRPQGHFFLSVLWRWWLTTLIRLIFMIQKATESASMSLYFWLKPHACVSERTHRGAGWHFSCLVAQKQPDRWIKGKAGPGGGVPRLWKTSGGVPLTWTEIKGSRQEVSELITWPSDPIHWIRVTQAARRSRGNHDEEVIRGKQREEAGEIE